MFNLDAYDYELPHRLIAQVPAGIRDNSRLMILDRFSRSIKDERFFNLAEYLRAGDLLVVNDTKVVPARLFGRKESGGKVEILVLDNWNHHQPSRSCLVKSSKRPKKGSLIIFDSDVTGVVEDILKDGIVQIKFRGEKSIDSLLEESGSMPLPPYIRRDEKNSDYTSLDKVRYQTVFATERGAVAAPTAGLHFTDDLFGKLGQKGIKTAFITLHVGLGTFSPVRTNDIREHILGREYYNISQKTADALNRTRKEGGRIVAVGTTVVRTLETVAGDDGTIVPQKGWTDILITPEYSFRIVDALVTNFHLPRSSLLFLVSALAGLDFITEAYEYAVKNEYRFYSYGDAMLIL